MQKALVGGCQFLVCIRCNNNLKKLQTEFVKKLAHAGRINIEDSKTPLRLEKGRPRIGSDPFDDKSCRRNPFLVTRFTFLAPQALI